MKDFEMGSIIPNTFSRYKIPTADNGWQWMEVYAAFVASISFLCIGVVQSCTSNPAMYSIESDGESKIILTQNDILWIASSPTLAAFVGTILSAGLLDYCGRQKSLIVSAIPSLLGWILIGFSSNVAMLHAGRAFTGLSIGISKATAPVYVSEISQPSWRGVLGFFPTMMNALGMLLGLWVGSWIHWRKFSIILTIFPTLLLLLSLWLPESPIWLQLHDQGEAAFKSLERFRGRGHKIRAQDEAQELRNSIEEIIVSMPRLNWKDLILRKENYLGFSLMVFQQFCGVSAVIFYSTMILSEATSSGGRVYRSLQPETAGLTVGIVHFVFLLVSLPLIDRLGRKLLLIMSGSLMAVSHLTIAGFLYFHLEPVHLTVSWLPLTGLCTFIAAFSIGFGPVPFVFITEVFSLKYRGYLSAGAALVSQIASFCVLQLFPILLEILSPHLVFLLFALICSLSVPFVIFLVPETKGKSLTEIEKDFGTHHSLLEEKVIQHAYLDKVEMPFLYVPVSRPIPTTPTNKRKITTTTIYCKSPAAL